MNLYLIGLAESTSHIRKLLGITQGEFSEMIGISRSTIVKIEQEPSKLTKAIALAMYTALQSEFALYKKKVESIDPNEYQNTESIKTFLVNNLVSLGPLINKSNLNSIISTANKLTPVMKKLLVGAAIGTLFVGITNKFKKTKKDHDTNLETVQVEWDVDTVQNLLESTKELIERKEQECLYYLKLSKWDALEFMTLIQESQID